MNMEEVDAAWTAKVNKLSVFMFWTLGTLGWVFFLARYFVPTAVERNAGACTRVLQCLDHGVAREQCDQLFPRCDPDRPVSYGDQLDRLEEEY